MLKIFYRNSYILQPILGATYDYLSIQTAVEFAQRCDKMMERKNFLWISFQTNCYADIVKVTNDYHEQFDKMRKCLQESGFHIANLKSNMRNTGPISSIGLDSTHGTLNVTNYVRHLKSSVEGAVPMIVPVHVSALKANLKSILRHTLESKSITGSVVILYSGRQFKSHELQSEIHDNYDYT